MLHSTADGIACGCGASNTVRFPESSRNERAVCNARASSITCQRRRLRLVLLQPARDKLLTDALRGRCWRLGLELLSSASQERQAQSIPGGQEWQLLILVGSAHAGSATSGICSRRGWEMLYGERRINEEAKMGLSIQGNDKRNDSSRMAEERRNDGEGGIGKQIKRGQSSYSQLETESEYRAKDTGCQSKIEEGQERAREQEKETGRQDRQ